MQIELKYDKQLEFFDIPNFIGYKINKIGQVYSDKSKQKLKTRICNGYETINIKINNINNNCSIHRLVALTFLPKPDGKDIVNHINSDKLDNKLENLEWVTQKENTAAHGKQIHHPKRVVQYDMDDNMIATFDSLIDAGNAIGFTPSAISKAVLGINSSAGGFKWKYADATNTINIDLSQGKKIIGLTPKDKDNYNYKNIVGRFLQPMKYYYDLELSDSDKKELWNKLTSGIDFIANIEAVNNTEIIFLKQSEPKLIINNV
jgi:hypothetical protein